MGETTLHVAAMLGHKYSVTTTGPSRVPAKDLQTRIRNADQSYSSALAMDMSVLEMDAYPQKAKKRILELARRAIEEEGVEVLVLGCAGLAAYADDIQQQLGIVVLDPTSVAIKITEAPVDLGLRHSKVARYAQPPKKQIK
jgi:allantoin racemase